MITRPFAGFRPASLTFLRALKRNNRREWFEANRASYEREIKAQLKAFVEELDVRFATVAPEFVGDPKSSLFRIHRDTRFSKDSTPYKAYTGIQFRHELGRDAHAPGFYLHLEPRAVFVGAGIWHPDATTLGRIREVIADDPKSWRVGKRFGERFQLTGDSLKRAPSGYDPEHPLIEDLKRKDFICVASLSEKDVCARGFVEEFAQLCREAAPLVRFLCAAVDVPY